MASDIVQTCYIGVGSNLGDRMANLKLADAMLGRLPETRVSIRSSVYETKPWGVIEQPDFLNMCLAIETKLPPHALLDAVLSIEAGAERRRAERWGPRTLDIDILLYGNHAIHDERLTIPHPRIAERVFVLIPLLEIAPDLSLNGCPLIETANSMGDQGICLIEHRTQESNHVRYRP